MEGNFDEYNVRTKKEKQRRERGKERKEESVERIWKNRDMKGDAKRIVNKRKRIKHTKSKEKQIGKEQRKERKEELVSWVMEKRGGRKGNAEKETKGGN